MPFLGNTPSNTFVSIAKQTITGNGGSSYTLSYPVTNANDLDVFYNNVRQEPNVAYTASGTTIAFTEAITSSDSVYVLYNGQAVGTIDAPAGAYLPTTGGSINGRLQIQQDATSYNRLVLRGTTGSSYRWNVDNFSSSNQFRIFRENDSDGSAGMVAAQFDALGRLILPQQPSFHVRVNQPGSWIQTSPIPWSQAVYNVGSCFNVSTYRFTAPIAGKYFIMGQILCHSTTGEYGAIFVRVNGTNTTYSEVANSTVNNNNTRHITAVFNLSAGDWFDVAFDQNGADYYGGNQETNLYGWLIG